MTGSAFPALPDHVYIVAEAEINHNGDPETALRMIDTAREIGADAVKFQYILADEIATPDQPQYGMFKKVELAHEDMINVFKYAEKKGLDCFITAPSVRTLKLSLECRPKYIKFGSTNITNLPLLKAAGEAGAPVILSTGLSTLGEIERALGWLGDAPAALLHCTVQYPAKAKDLNLNAMRTMQAAFPGRVIGYSDHTEGEWAAAAAVTMGARIIEKHFTLDRNQEGPDHGFSTDPNGFARLVGAIRNTEAALGRAEKGPSETEKPMIEMARRYVVATRPIFVGEPLGESNVDVRRAPYTEGNIGSRYFEHIAGWAAPRDYQPGQALNWNHFKVSS